MFGLLATAALLASRHVGAIEIPGNFANLAAAATTDPAVTACSIAFAVVDSCYSASPGLSTAAESDAAACLCCHSTVEIDEYYSSCADYIATSFPESSTQYSAFAGLAGACASEVPTCRAGAGAGGGASATASRTPSNTRTTVRTTASATRTGSGGGGAGGSGATDVPDACTSFQDIVSSCIAATPSITAAPNSVAASCVCYTTTRGTSSFTTEIDDLASSCAPWAKTNAPASVYSAVLEFEDFCDNFSPADAKTDTDSTATTTSTRGGGFGAGVGGGATTTTSATSSKTSTSATSTRALGPSANVAPEGGARGLVVWTAEMFSAVLLFFLLV